MEIILFSFLGIVQGLTEFLPVSSSGHLFIAETALGKTPDLFLETWLHAASLVAVLWYFRAKLWTLSLSIFKRDDESKPKQKLVLQLILSTLITLPLALLLVDPLTGGDFLSLRVVGITLLVTGLLIVISERLAGTRTNLRWIDAVLAGAVQGMAVIPGISRSGITIAALVSAGISKREAVEYSFLLSIPIIFAALLYGIISLPSGAFILLFSWPMIISFFVTTAVSYLAIAYMIRFVERHWIYFAPYCFILGATLIII